jgi:hypothetical protein
MVVIFTLGILFYDSMPNNKVSPNSITYTAEASVTSVIQEISAEKEESATANNSSSSSTLEDELLNIGSVIASYSLGSSELSTYAARNTYESGKVDPFADYVEETPTEGTDNTENSGSSGNATSSSSTGTASSSSTGKLFENKTTK